MDYRQRFKTCFLAADYAGAVKAISAAIDQTHQNSTELARDLCNRAEAHRHLELNRKAMQDCKDAIAADPTYVYSYLRLGDILTCLGKKAEAVEMWERGCAMPFIEDISVYITLAERLATQSRTGKTQTPTASPTTQSSPGGSTLSRKTQEKAESVDLENATLAATQVAEKGLVQHGVGNAEVDRKIALGYLHVNTGKHEQAVTIFNELLQKNPHLVAAYLGRGTTFALSGKLREAIRDFSLAIQEQPSCSDAHLRRGQALAAVDEDTLAIEDISKAIHILTETGKPEDVAEAVHQRGLLYLKLHNYVRATSDFREATRLHPLRATSWNSLGLCLTATGSAADAIDACARAVTIQPTFKEAWINIGQVWRELGVFDKALQLFEKALEIDPRYRQTYFLKGMLFFLTGRHAKSAVDFDSAIELLGTDVSSNSAQEVYHMRAVVNHGLGRISLAVQDYDCVVSVAPSHVAWYQRECALFVLSHLDDALLSFNYDDGMDPYFKEAWCKRHHPATLSRYKPQPRDCLSFTKDVSGPMPPNPILSLALAVGRVLQYDSPGFIVNLRQHMIFGLAALEIAQWLRKTWSDAGSTSTWRDMYQLAVRWRQLSEPNDPVWWVDKLSPEQFQEGFGSHTPMVTGQAKVIRYYPQYARAFSIMKSLMPTQCPMLSGRESSIKDAPDCTAVYQLMQHDFWVVTPCHSLSRPGHIMEGTRLTLQASPPEGFEFSIRTPGTPPRWVDYDKELTWAWENLRKSALSGSIDMAINAALTLAFYWYNFMPLSRGTAAVGFVGILGTLLALGRRISTQAPKGMQVDWEAILGPTPAEFITVVGPWIRASLVPVNIDKVLPITKMAPTVRSALEAIAAAETITPSDDVLKMLDP